MPKFRLPKAVEGNYRNWSSLAAYRADARSARAQLREIRKPSGSNAGIRLFSAMRNELDLLPLFLDHYRKLGVGRFVIVDNDSSDGTRELLLDQPDVELHHAAASYAEANGGSLWVDGLIEEQARDEWVVYVDADELLVYDRCEEYLLPALADRLAGLGQHRLLAPLLDVYPHPDPPHDLLFDAAPEIARQIPLGVMIEGGPRYRMATAVGRSQSPCLTKFPFLRYRTRTAFANIHFPEPTRENGSRVRGRLLHLKLTSRFRDKVERALREGQHWQDGAEYKSYADWLEGRDTGDLVSAASRRYTGPRDLIEAGLLEPLRWDRSNASLRISEMLRWR